MISSLSVRIAFFAFSATASASSLDLPPCDDPLGYQLADKRLVAEHYQCESDDVCGVSFKTPMVLDDRRFLGFLLLFSDGRQGTITLAHTSDEQEEFAYSAFELPRSYFRDTSVHAIYDFKTHCHLHSVWTPADIALLETDRRIQLVRETIESLSGKTSRNYMTYDFGRARDASAVSVVVPEAQAFELVSQLREQIPDGYIAFAGTNRWLGDDDHGSGVEVVVAKGADKYDILRLARTNAVDYGMMTDDLIAWFKAHEQEIEVDIVQASTDTIFGAVLSGPEDMDDFIEKLYEFCPDIVDQGSGNKEDLRQMLGTHRNLFLWWD